ncbi:MAG: hypothetical protein INQ03_18100 [Candidatus Heimdallarchaeota archaeon]|nr:hypothetical protein [Candidatus Heimdallarchaeota archaeon]
MDKNLILRILVFGDSKTGKTSLVRKYLEKGFRTLHRPTLGTEISTITYEYDISKYPKKLKTKKSTYVFDLQIMDFASTQIQEILQKDRLFTGNTGICFVFDVGRLDSYLNTSHILTRINERYPRINIPILLVGNMKDKKYRMLSDDDIQQYVDNLRQDKRIRSKFIDYMVISVKDDEDVSSIFDSLADQIIMNLNFKRGKFVV